MRRGFTLIEILIVVTIIGILTVFIIYNFSSERTKAENSRIKSDLHRLKIAFEDYYNDHNCYPPTTWFDNASDCNSSQFAPYLAQIPCDPHTGNPYVIETNLNSPVGCVWFKLYGNLKNPTYDPDAMSQYSDTGSSLGNYGVSSSNTSVTVFFADTPSPTPVQSPLPSANPANIYYCQGYGNCSSIPQGQTCTPGYPDPNCGTSNGCAATISVCN